VKPIAAIRRKPRFSGLLSALLALALLAGAAAAAIWLEPERPRLSGMARASDGDSLRLGDERIRLIGLDAPELHQTCTGADARPWPCGEAAKRRLATLLVQGPLDCRTEGRDRFGRVLARCAINGRDPAAVMVAEGLAVAYGDYGAEEAQARRDRIGLWAGNFTPPRAFREQGGEGQPSWLDWLVNRLSS
jgi:endonuclease YncB( thermonuclease family)